MEAILAHLLELEARVVVEQVMVELLELPTQAVAGVAQAQRGQYRVRQEVLAS